jgi:hypothetical protein
VYLRVLCGEFLGEDFNVEGAGVYRGKFFRGSLGVFCEIALRDFSICGWGALFSPAEWLVGVRKL